MTKNKKVTLTKEEVKTLEKAGDILSNIARKITMYEFDYCEAVDCVTCCYDDLESAIETLNYFCINFDIDYK